MAATLLLLKATGPRQPVTLDEVAQYTKDWQELLQQDNRPVRLDLAERVWKPDVLRALLDDVPCDRVQELVVWDIIASLMTDDGLQTMGTLAEKFGSVPNLRHLDLADNALGTRAMELLAPLFRQPLEFLSLHNCGMAAEAAEKLILSPTLVELRLGRNQNGVQGAQALQIASCLQLKRFSYDGCRPLKEGTLAIIQQLHDLVLAGNTGIETLNLNDCDFEHSEDDDRVSLLVQVLQPLTQLKTCILGDATLGEEGFPLVLEALEGKKLEVLDLSGCEIGEEGAELLATFLESQIDTLRVLKLATNELGDTGCSTVWTALAKSKVLETLSFEENELEDASFLLEDTIPSLTNLCLKDNMDLSVEHIREWRRLYGTVEVDDDQEPDDDEEEDDEDVAELTQVFQTQEL